MEDYDKLLNEAREAQRKSSQDERTTTYCTIRELERDTFKDLQKRFAEKEYFPEFQAFHDTLNLDYISDAFGIGKSRFNYMVYEMEQISYPFFETSLLHQYDALDDISLEHKMVTKVLLKGKKGIYEILETNPYTAECVVKDVLDDSTFSIFDQGLSLMSPEVKKPLAVIAFLFEYEDVRFFDYSRPLDESKKDRLIADFKADPSLFNSIQYGFFFKDLLREKAKKKKRK